MFTVDVKQQCNNNNNNNNKKNPLSHLGNIAMRTGTTTTTVVTNRYTQMHKIGINLNCSRSAIQEQGHLKIDDFLLNDVCFPAYNGGSIIIFKAYKESKPLNLSSLLRNNFIAISP